MHQQSNQLVQSLIAALNKLEEQQDPVQQCIVEAKAKAQRGEAGSPKGSKNPEKKKLQLKFYNCDKIGHIAKEYYASKKEKKTIRRV